MARPFTRHDLDTLLDRLSSAEASCQSIRENNSQFLNDLDNTNAEIQSVRNDVKSLQRYILPVFYYILWRSVFIFRFVPRLFRAVKAQTAGQPSPAPAPRAPPPAYVARISLKI
jgi:hypothetical protein